MIPGWKDEIEGEYLAFLREHPKATLADLAAHLGTAECCVIYWLTDLARDGRIRILSFELVEEGGVQCEAETAQTCQRTASCPADRSPGFPPGVCEVDVTVGESRPDKITPATNTPGEAERVDSKSQEEITRAAADRPNEKGEQIGGLCWLADAMGRQ